MSSEGNGNGLDPALLDRLRRGFPLRMDARGAFWFEGDALDHPRVVAYFRAHIDADEAGDPIILVDGKYVYLECDDTPFRVTRVVAGEAAGEPAAAAPHLVLDDGRVVPLESATLREETDRGLRCEVPAAHSGRPMAARLGNTAAMDLDRWITWDGDVPHLDVGGARTPIPTFSGPAA